MFLNSCHQLALSTIKNAIMNELRLFLKTNKSRIWRVEFAKQVLGRKPSDREAKLFSRCRAWLEDPVRARGNAKGKKVQGEAGLGRRVGMQPVRDALFEWFCRLRSAVKGRFPRIALVMQANKLKELYIAKCLANQMKPDVVQIRSRWILAFLKHYHVAWQCVFSRAAFSLQPRLKCSK